MIPLRRLTTSYLDDVVPNDASGFSPMNPSTMVLSSIKPSQRARTPYKKSVKSVLQATLHFYSRNENSYAKENLEKQKESINKSVIFELSRVSEGSKVHKRMRKELSPTKYNPVVNLKHKLLHDTKKNTVCYYNNL